jgi:hypothetical protein
MVRLELSIDDAQWPKLKLIALRTDLNGQKTAVTKTILYDQAYNQFESDLHNQLRPMVEQLINRRMLSAKR